MLVAEVTTCRAAPLRGTIRFFGEIGCVSLSLGGWHRKIVKKKSQAS
jgi:hypothetical protein